MSQNVIAAQKVRSRASAVGSVEPPRGPPNPKRDIRGDARLGIVQTRNALPSDPARARLPPRPRADLSPRSNTQAIQAAKGYVHFRGSSLVRLPRPRFTGGLEQNPLARDARPRLVESTWLALRTRKRAERAFRQKKKTRRAPPDRRFPSPFAAGHRDVHDHPHGLRRGRHHAPGEGHR